MRQKALAAAIGSMVGLLGVYIARGQAQIDEKTWIALDHKAIRYNELPLNDPVSRLEKQLESGAVKLDYQPGLGYLPALLKALNIDPDSQVLVFSKTSFQATKIGPRAPRAIFFNDEVAVGSVQEGDVFELVSLDPKQGMIFYTLDVHPSDKPGFARRDVCLQCHQGPATSGVPGILVSSVYPGGSGMPAFKAGLFVTDHRSRLEDRWGGWYVTGTHGSTRHMGNAIAPDPSKPQILESHGTQNLTSLSRKFDASNYMAPTSDIVALMTLEHQTRMTNLMTRVGWEARVVASEGKTTSAALDGAIEEMVGYMLFADEAPLREPVAGVSSFSKTFPARGPKDKQGRSLRDFDLQKRMFRYPLSYMIYTPAFDALPDSARERVLRRVYDVLTGKDTSPKFARLSAEDRKAVLEIVRETKPSLPAYWKN